MKKFYSPFCHRTVFVLLFMLTFVKGWGQVNMTTSSSYSQDFTSLTASGTWTDNTTIPNWYATQTAYTYGTGSATAGALYSFGVAGTNAVTDRALGSLESNGTGNIAYGLQLKNNTSSAITSMTYAFTGEQWRRDPNTIADPIILYYRIYSSAQTSIDNSSTGWTLLQTVNNPVTGTAAAIDGNATANRTVVSATSISSLSIPAGSFIVFKWINSNVSGNDQGMAIDDVSIAWTIAPACTNSDLIFGISAITKNVGDANFTQTATSNSSGAISYSSNNTSVANVNASTGEVTIGTAGTATITATQLAAGSFCASTTTYTVTVNSTAPTINTSGTLAAVNTTYGTASATPTSFTVSATNLAANLVITPPAGFEISESNTFTTSFTNASPLSITPATGAVSSRTIYVRLAATTEVGTYGGNIALTSAGATTVNVATVSSTVSKKQLTIAITASNKVYDATNAVNLGSPTLSGVVVGDSVFLSGAPTGTFDNKNVGTGKTVTVTGLSLGGPKALNYSLPSPITTTANITAKALTIENATASNKVYDGTSAAVISGTLTGVSGADNVTFTGTGTFVSINVGTGISVNSTSSIPTTGDAANYTLTQPTGLTANITKATPIFTPTTISVGVNGNQTIPSSISNSPGTLSFVSNNTGIVTVNATTGVVTGVAIGSTTVNVTQAESTNYIAGSASVTVNVSAIAYLTGDYRTIGTGNWVSTAASPAIWERLDSAGNWNASNAPNYNTTNNVYIRDGHVITATGSFSNGVKLKVMQGGVFQANNSATAASIYVYTGGELRINAALTVTGTFDVEDNANVYLNASISNPNTTIWAGTENFRPQSNFYIWNWNTATNLYNNNISANSSGTIFGNLTIDTLGGTAGNWNLLGSSTETITLTSGDLVFNSGQANIRFFAETGSIANVTVKGNLKLNSGWTSARTLALSSAGVINLTVDGNVVIDSPGALAIKQANSAASGASLNVKGNLEMNGPNTSSTTKLHLNAANAGTAGGGKAIINLYKNLLVGSSASITNSVPTADVEFNFVGSTKQLVNILSPVSGSETDNTRGIPFYIKPTAFVELTNDLTLSNGSRFVVENNGTLDFGFTGLTPHVIKHGTTGNSAFVSQAGSILRITSPLGLSTTGNIGNVQVTATAATRDFSSIGTFHYIGKANQVTGNALSASSEKNVIVEMNADNLELRPSATFGITNTGVLDIRKGKVVETETEYVTGSTGTLRMAPATYYKITKASTTTSDYIPRLDNVVLTGGEIELASTDNQTLRGGKTYYDLTFSGGATKELSTGTSDVNGLISILSNTILDGKTFTVGKTATQLLMDSGSRFRTGGNGAKPDAGGTYVLDPTSTIEFQGDSATKIKVTPQYENVDVSGSNVETGGKNFTVNNLLKVTNSTAMLSVPEILTDSDTPYVVTAKKGIQVVTGGKAIFGNNANLLQDVDAANTGNITMLRNATVPNVQFNFWSSPVKDQTLYSLYTGVPLVMEYNSANDLFKTLPSASNPKSVFGKGYSIQGPSSSTTAPYLITAKFEGVPNNESSAVGSNTVTLSTAGYNYNLIGNPFPSNLNLVELYNANASQFYNDGTSATPTAFLWDNTGNTQMTQLGSAYSGYALNNYATVNLSSGIGTPASILGASGKKPNGIIRPGQGFIMRASETATGLVFKNNLMRTSAIVNNGTNSQYFKNNSTEANDHFWLKLSTSRNVNIVIALSYNRDATNAFERFDSAVLNEGVTENFYSLSSDSKKLAIQTRKGDLDPQDVIPLVIKISENGDQKIGIDDKTGIFKENQNIYLKDKLMNKTVNLSNGDYTFSAAKGTDATRFEIVFKDDLVLGTDASSKSDFTVYRDGSDYVVRSSKILGNVEVYDAAGRLVRSLKSTQKNVRLDGATLNEGLYIIRAENSGDIRTKKILK